MTTIRVVFKLDGIRCYQSGETPADEPYLWTLFFKADGETLVFNSDNMKLQTTKTVSISTPSENGGFEVDPGHHGHHPPPGSHAHGHPTTQVVTGPPEATIDYRNASEGNIGTTNVRNVRTGEFVAIPDALGRWETTLKPIPVHSTTFGNVGSVGGFIGCVVVLMEEDRTPSSAIDQGHGMFNQAVAAGINSILDRITIQPGTDLNNKAAVEKQIDDLISGEVDRMQASVQAQVKAKVRENVGVFDWIWAGGDMDDTIGSQVFRVKADDIASQRLVFVSRQWGQPTLEAPAGGSDGNWGLYGHVSVIWAA